MPIKFGNVGISGIVCSNAGSILSDVSGVAITNSVGQLVGNISLPKNFTKLKSEGSKIVGFSVAGIRDDLLVPFTKSTSGEDLTFNRSDIIDFISYEPDGLVIESNEYSVDLDSNEPVSFKFYYPFNQNKFVPDRTLIASNISSLLYFLQQQEENPSSKIQNAFNFNINDLIIPSGDDISIASGTISQAIETSKRIAVLVQATTSLIQGASELDCFQALATSVATETVARSGVQTFFEEKSSGIILSTIASVSGLTSIAEIPQEVVTQTINLATNINYIATKDVENFDRGNKISSLVLVKNILQQGIDLKADNATVATAISEKVETIASGILGNNYVMPCDIYINDLTTTTTTTTTAAPTTTSTTTTTTVAPIATDQYFNNVALLLHADGTGSSFVDSSPASKTITAVGGATQSAAQSKWGGKSLALDGSTANLSLPSSSFTMTGDFVIEAWVYLSNVAIYAPIAETRASPSYANFICGVYNVNGTLRPDFVTAGGAGARLTGSSTSISLNTWTHIAFVRSNGVISVFVDGVRDSTQINYSSTINPASSTMLIGRNVDGHFFNGYIDDLRITIDTDRGFTGATITVPTEAFPEDIVSPTDQYFNNVALLLHADGTGSSFVDSSPTPKTITAVGGATQSAAQSKWGGKSLALDGSTANLSLPSTSFTMSGDFVIEAWVYLSSVYYYAPIVETRASGSFSNFMCGIYNIGLTNPRPDFVTAGGRLTGSSDFPINTWTHIAFVRSSGVISLYVNGVRNAAQFNYSSAISPASSTMLIGKTVDGQFFGGYIDDLRITVDSDRGYTGPFIRVPASAFPDAATS